jgi:hypothetical protein
MGLSFTIAVGLRQRIHSQVRVSQETWPIFTVSDSRAPNLEGQVPVFISPRKRFAHLHTQAVGSLSVVSYVSQGYGGGIRPHLHTEFADSVAPIAFLPTPLHGPSIKHRFQSTSTVACVSVATGTRLPSCCLETALVYLLISRSFYSNTSTRYNRINSQ